MKEIKAIFRRSKLLDVIEALQHIDSLPGVTVSEIKGFGKGRAKNSTDKIIYEMVEFVPRIKMEVVVNDEMVEEVVHIIQKFSHTGNAGDGKIFVSPVEDVVKIRTNERGKIAI